MLVDQIRVIPSLLRLTHKARGVVVPHSLGVPESFQQRVGLDDLILQSPLSARKQVKLLWKTIIDSTCQNSSKTNLHFRTRFLFLVRRNCDRREILNDTFSVDGLSCARFSA